MEWIKNQIKWIESFLSEPEPSGKGSMKRVIMASVTASFVYSYLSACIAQKALLDIPTNWMIMIGGMIGLGVADWYVKTKQVQ